MSSEIVHWSEKEWVQKGIYNGEIKWYNTILPHKYNLPFCWPEFICRHRCTDNNPIFSLGTLPLHRGATTRRIIMEWEVRTELVVQEKDDKSKKKMIVKYSTMTVFADDFDEASTAAKELCLAGENITSCSVILVE